MNLNAKESIQLDKVSCWEYPIQAATRIGLKEAHTEAASMKNFDQLLALASQNFDMRPLTFTNYPFTFDT